MNPQFPSSRNGHHHHGIGDGAAVTDESASAWSLSPISAADDLPPAHTGDMADWPITLKVADRAALDGPMDGTEAPPTSDTAYEALHWGRWPAETSTPTPTLVGNVLQNLSGPLVVLDADLRVRLANRAFCQTFQVAPDKIEGRWLPELGFGDRDAPGLHERLNQILSQDAQIASSDLKHDLLTVGRRTVMIHAQRLSGPGPGDNLILLELDDVSERKAAERHRRELIVTAVHELRNPLTAIKGYAQLLLGRKDTNERALSVILEEAKKLTRLVDDLLASSGPDVSYLLLQPSLVDLIALTRASAEQAQLLNPGHLIRVEAADQSLEGLWDGERLAQVFANLLGNAVKYSSAGGEIVVRIHDLGPTVGISVSDQGVGIASDAVPHIFDQFYRVPETANMVPGLGLGLHVTKTMVEAHGGSISVHSVLGKGSTFSVELPRAAPVPAARADVLTETAR